MRYLAVCLVFLGLTLASAFPQTPPTNLKKNKKTLYPDVTPKKGFKAHVDISDNNVEFGGRYQFPEWLEVALRMGLMSGCSFLGGRCVPNPTLRPSPYTTLATKVEGSVAGVKVMLLPTVSYAQFNTQQTIVPDVPNEKFRAFKNKSADSGAMSLYSHILVPINIATGKAAAVFGLGTGNWQLYPHGSGSKGQALNEFNATMAAGYKLGKNEIMHVEGQVTSFLGAKDNYRNPAKQFVLSGVRGAADITSKKGSGDFFSTWARFRHDPNALSRAEFGSAAAIKVNGKDTASVSGAARYQKGMNMMNPDAIGASGKISYQFGSGWGKGLYGGADGHYLDRVNQGTPLAPDYSAGIFLGYQAPDGTLIVKARKNLARGYGDERQDVYNDLLEHGVSTTPEFEARLRSALEKSSTLGAFAKNLKPNDIRDILMALEVMTRTQEELNYNYGPDSTNTPDGQSSFKAWRDSYLNNQAKPAFDCTASAQTAVDLSVAMAKQANIALSAATVSLQANDKDSQVGGHAIAALFDKSIGFILVDWGRIQITGTADPKIAISQYDGREATASALHYYSGGETGA
ncbi:MAG: hypothetical protein AABZ44_09090, partial [Elusimicrobiota bacterium]